MTKHRQLIHRIIQESDDHLTADQIYFLAKQEMPSIAIGTVYRNLNLMVKDEEIRRVQLAGEPDRFDRALLPHDHMLCQRCGKLLDVQLQGLLQKLEEDTGTSVLSYDLKINILCPQRRKELDEEGKQ